MTATTTDSKLCRQCGQTKPIADFHANRSAANGLQAYCKDCNAETGRRWRAANPDRVRTRARRYTIANRPRTAARMRQWRADNPDKNLALHLRTRYNLTLEDHAALLAEQGGRCALCQRSDKKLHVDHDHRCCPGRTSCGRCVRGLLCGYCNRALGLFGDDPENVLATFGYLAAPPAAGRTQ